jgi:uncharacterized protein (DUF488 family)
MYTIGHSTLPIEVFVDALRENGVRLLVDIRTIPRSRHNPQFGKEELPGSLAAAGIDYRWMRELGGLRHSKRDSVNQGWRNLSFRGYADYMQTPEFAHALDELVEFDEHTAAAIMCSEAVPWRCHRSLVGDALLVRKRPVEDIFVASTGKSHRKLHKLTPFARVEGARLWYPGDAIQQELGLQKSASAEKTSRVAAEEPQRDHR